MKLCEHKAAKDDDKDKDCDFSICEDCLKSGYDVLTTIGSGPFYKVKLGYDKPKDEYVALRFINPPEGYQFDWDAYQKEIAEKNKLNRGMLHSHFRSCKELISIKKQVNQKGMLISSLKSLESMTFCSS